MIKIGDKIIFTKEKYQYPDKFTFGKKYIILNISKIVANNKTLIQVLDDNEEIIWVNYDYFDDINILRKIKLKRIINTDD